MENTEDGNEKTGIALRAFPFFRLPWAKKRTAAKIARMTELQFNVAGEVVGFRKRVEPTAPDKRYRVDLGNGLEEFGTPGQRLSPAKARKRKMLRTYRELGGPKRSSRKIVKMWRQALRTSAMVSAMRRQGDISDNARD